MRTLTASMALVVFCSCALALDKNDLLGLTKAGVSDEIIVKVIETGDQPIKLTADDVKALRTGGVSEKVIVAALTSSVQWKERPQKKTEAAKKDADEDKPKDSDPKIAVVTEAPAKTSTPPVVVPGEDEGVVLIENLMQKSIALTVDEEKKLLEASFKGDAASSYTIGKEDSRSISLSEDSYRIRWLGQDYSYKFQINKGKTTKLSLAGDKDVTLVLTDSDGNVKKVCVLLGQSMALPQLPVYVAPNYPVIVEPYPYYYSSPRYYYNRYDYQPYYYRHGWDSGYRHHH